MKLYHQQVDQPVFGKQVKTFPQGIGDAFDALLEMIPDGNQRTYFGWSTFSTSGTILYWAAAAEILPGEAEKYGCERLIIPKGDYLSVTVHNWRTRTDTLKDVFHELMEDGRTDNTKPCIEWYYKDDEMLCMLQIK